MREDLNKVIVYFLLTTKYLDAEVDRVRWEGGNIREYKLELIIIIVILR